MTETQNIEYKQSWRDEYRSGSTKQVLKGPALDRFLLQKQGCHWDSVPIPYVSLKDLDDRALAHFRKRAANSKRLSPDILDEPDADLIDKLHLTDGDYLKRAAVLLFHPDPEKFVTGAFVKIGYFRNNANLLYQDEVHGDLFTQVRQTLDLLLTKYLKALISYEGIQRVETYPIPEEALREAVINAIAHRDYGSGAPIQISVYEEKIMIWNSGQLPRDWDVKRLLRKHSSQPYNPDIANAFFRAGMIEAWGRGIERIMESCDTADVPRPELRYETGGLWIIFRFRMADQADGKTSPAIQETPRKTPRKPPRKTGQKILTILRRNPSASRREMAALLEDISEYGVQYHLDRLKSEGRIRRIGPPRGGEWKILEKEDG